MRPSLPSAPFSSTFQNGSLYRVVLSRSNLTSNLVLKVGLPAPTACRGCASISDNPKARRHQDATALRQGSRLSRDGPLVLPTVHESSVTMFSIITTLSTATFFRGNFLRRKMAF